MKNFSKEISKIIYKKLQKVLEIFTKENYKKFYKNNDIQYIVV